MLPKRLDYGFNGYQVPFFPRAARSSRRRGTIQKKVEDDNKMCAFDLLASIAGKLLLEGETHSTYTGKDQAVNDKDVVMEEQHLEGNPLEVKNCDKGIVGIPSLSLELGLQVPAEKCDISSPHGSINALSYFSEKHTSLDKTDIHDDKSELCNHSIKSEGFSPVHGEGELVLENLGDTKFSDEKPHALFSTDSSIQQALVQEKCPYDSSHSPSKGNNVVVVRRDDEENYSECTQPSTMKTTRSPARIGDRRIRKLLASKYWRVTPKVKNGDFSDTAAEMHCLYRNRKLGYKRQRSQRIYPFKKRKFVRYSSLSSSERNIGPKGFGAVGHGVNGSSSCVAGQSTPFKARESHVKLRIKSFRVPELYVEMPETATIGLLKRTVMETVTALLGGGSRVGVLLQGKRIRDDSRTLLQSGICHNGKVQSLGFALEPNPSYTNPRVCSEDNSYILSTDVPDSTRCPLSSTINQGTSHFSTDHPVNSTINFIESDHDSTPSPAAISAEKGTVDSQALISLFEEPPQAFSVVPSCQKSNRSELAQRRIRRPFSVAEVEALVQAVEKLGTGRWRDVKLRAFDNVRHRTYVDLKDKWKTLVHTAKISPQQRRGQPVPQELLDRVLAAHSYWCQHQAKHQLKQEAEPCLLL